MPTSKYIKISKSNRVRVGITFGDPSGIGPAVIKKAFNKINDLASLTIIGDRWVFDKIKNPEIRNYNFIDLHNVPRNNFSFGKIKAEYGRASIEYLDKALELIKGGKIDCLVTGPVCKCAINKAGIDFKGHTEYLAKRTNTKDYLMLLLNKELKLSLVTRHIPFKRIRQELNSMKIYKTTLLTYRSLKELFRIYNPRIVVCALNPHASDNGLIGDEEDKIIKPALNKLRERIGNIDGPLPSDTAIRKAKDKEYDCVVTLYHDQALIPLKLLNSHTGVNLTFGLPFVRTSPLHGTAFDIANEYQSLNPQSLIQAVRLAIKCTRNIRAC